jgi:uncharacterized repeat protein (TIGR03803 family)
MRTTLPDRNPALVFNLRALNISQGLAIVLMLTVSVTAHAQTFNVIHTFTGGGDGASPDAGLTMDQAGDLYGTTTGGDPGGQGPSGVFKLSNKGSGWVLTPIYTFVNGSGGIDPQAGVVLGPDGSLYGTTAYGGFAPPAFRGGCTYGCGTVFNLKPPETACATGLCPWSESVPHIFMGGSDGAYPVAAGGFIFDQAGNLYGTSGNGGMPGACDGFGCGTVFKLSPSGSGWTESILYRFTGGNDGSGPFAGLIFDQAGNLYGTTVGGGQGSGTVFMLSPSGSGWTESVLYSFSGGADGAQPFAGLIFDSSGNLYGATAFGGEGGAGTIFKMTPSNGSWTLETLYSFIGGIGPLGNLVMDRVGNLYGTTFQGGSANAGTVFELTPNGNGDWKYTSLHDFCAAGGNCSDGSGPVCNVMFDTNGNLYGTAYYGGANGKGVVWEITPQLKSSGIAVGSTLAASSPSSRDSTWNGKPAPSPYLHKQLDIT